MTEAEKLFNDVVARCFDRWRLILSFRITSTLGMEAAKKDIELQKIKFVSDMLQSSDYDKVLMNKELFFKMNPPDKIVQDMTEQTIRETEMAMNAASIVFAHSVLDGAALDYCRVTGLVAPRDWESVVENRKLSLAEMRSADYEEALRQKLDEFFAQLERESLLKKAEYLFTRCQPPEKWSPMNNYAYDRERLERLDRFRHEVIHGESLGKPIANASDEVEYLMKTALFFMGLVNLKYKLMIDPAYVILDAMPKFNTPS